MQTDINYIFLILSNQPYDFELKTNKWHIANELSRRGYRVIFVDPPLRFKALKSFLKNPSINIFKIFCSEDRKRDNLIVYKPANLFNFYPFSWINTKIHSRKILRLIEKYKENNKSKLIIWVYHFDFPDIKNFLNKFKRDLLIYDVVDEYTAFPEYASRKKVNTGIVSKIQWLDDEMKIRLNQHNLQGADWVLYIEKWLAENSELMFASAPGLVKKFQKWRDQVAYLPNGADVKKFDLDKDDLIEPEDMKNIPHPRIGFSGAIDTYKNNIPLIEKCGKKYPNYHFVLIGPEKVADPDLDLKELKSMPNVHFLGLKPWEVTPMYFNYFDGYFIPYNLNDYTVKGCFPVKYFESLAAGLPTIVTNMPAYEGFDVDGYVSKSDEEFVENIKRALAENSEERRKKRKLLAGQNSWSGKVDKQLKLINDFFKQKSAS